MKAALIFSLGMVKTTSNQFYFRKVNLNMKTIGNTVIVGVDHGYGNLKTANTVTPTGIIAYDSKPTFEGNVILYKGVHYRIGEGHKAFISDKVADNDYYVMTLAAIARELNHHGITTADVQAVATGKDYFAECKRSKPQS